MSGEWGSARQVWLLAGLLAPLPLAGCGATITAPAAVVAPVAGPVVITGSVGYLERIAMPPGMQVEIELLDIAKAGAPATVVSRQAFTLQGRQMPIPFRFELARSDLPPTGRFSMSARLRDSAGSIQWRTTSIHSVDLAASTVEVGLVRLVRTRAPALRRQSYACADGQPLVATFLDEKVIIDRGTGLPVTLPQRPSGSGFLYELPTHGFSGKGMEVRYRVGQAEVLCRAELREPQPAGSAAAR
mgnify:CR=1 FL=1